MDDNIRLECATIEDKDRITHLYQYYLHDLSEFNQSLQLNSEGLFDCEFVHSYFCENNLIPSKITLQDRLIGFIFCSTGQSVDYIVQDVFVLRNYRNKGFGRSALKQLFNFYSGRFGLYILVKNKPAELFWKNCLEHFGIRYTSRHIDEDGEQPVTRILFDFKRPLPSN